jgi:methionine aminotransferase
MSAFRTAMQPRSKLPDVGTTIFTVMSRRAAELGAVNLGQGFPDYPIDPQLAERVHAAMLAGHNQYAPMPGNAALREQIARRIAADPGVVVDPDTEITITLGATEAIYSGVQALVGAGEQAVVFDPAYDSYDPAVRLAGAHCVHVPLQPPAFRIDWDRVRAALTPRTRLVIVNSPQNPACTCLAPADLDELAALLRDRETWVLSDEVYQHVVFDGLRHASVLAHPELRARSVAVFSFGKTLHATGLRVGYAVAPPALTAELRKVHQFNTFSIASALQQAVAEYVAARPDWGAELAAFFGARRDQLRGALAGSGCGLPPAQGTYFQLLEYGGLSTQGDLAFAERLLTEAGVATIPLSPFYREPPATLRYLRLCFAKREATLLEGARRISAWVARGGGAARVTPGAA